MLTGEHPEVNPEVRERLHGLGPRGLHRLRGVDVRAGAGARAAAAHEPRRALGADDLARLREVTASQGLMLESVNPDLVVHQGSPTKDPARRLETIAAAGELRIPFTSGILVGIGETEDERVAALEALAEVHAEHGHLQEVILQNFVPHRRYYGEEPAEIADAAAERFWRTGVGATRPTRRCPSGRRPVSIEEMKRLIGEAQRLMPGVGIQVPPNLADWWPELVAAGATDLGGLSANGDHISPEHPFPSPAPGAQAPGRRRRRADRAAVRVPAVHRPRVGRRRACSTSSRLKYWSFIPRRGSGRGEAPRPIRRDAVAGAIARARDGVALARGRADRAVRRDRPEAIEDMRQAADELRAELAGDDGHVRRQPQHQRLQRLRRRLRVLRLRPGQALARRLRALPRGVRAPRARGGRLRRDRGLHAVGHPPRLGRWRTTRSWLRVAKGAAPEIHLHAYSPMEVAHMCDVVRPGARRGVRAAARGRAGLDAGHRGRGPARRRARAHLAEQAAGGALGGDHRGLAPRRPALDGHGDVRPHRGAVGAGRAHARRARAAGAHRRVHRVRAAARSSRSTRCSGARTASRRSRARRTSSTPRSSASRWAGRSATCRRAG